MACGCVAVWLCGCVAVWLCGCVAVWLCGCARENIPSLPKAMYLMIVTISTVGYGDVTPESTSGHVVITATIVCSVLYTAMPIGIIGNAFTQIWTDRDRILLTVRTRERLAQWGYTAKDMQMVFQKFDRNRSGELTLPEFRKMIAEMSIGIQDQDERVVQLFESFDRDGSGGIDEKEFTRALFPSTYHELYARRPENPDFRPFPFMHFQVPGLTTNRSWSRRNSMINEEDENDEEGNYCRLPMPRLGGRRTSLTRSVDSGDEPDSRQESPSSFFRLNFGRGARSSPRKRRSSILQKHSSSLRSSKNTLEGTDSHGNMTLDGHTVDCNLQSSESDRSIGNPAVETSAGRKGSVVSMRSHSSKTSRTHAKKGQTAGQPQSPSPGNPSTAGQSMTQLPPAALPAGQPAASEHEQAKEDGPDFPPLFAVVC